MRAYGNVIWWYTQRLTGALLVPLLAAHFWVEHYMSDTLLRGELTYEAILARISNPLWQAIDISFLVVALVHGLNGFRSIVLDYSRVGPRAARAITAAMMVIGVVWTWWGVRAFRGL